MSAATRRLRGPRHTARRKVMAALSPRIDLDLSQVAVKALLAPDDTKAALQSLAADGMVRVVQDDQTHRPRYVLATKVKNAL